MRIYFSIFGCLLLASVGVFAQDLPVAIEEPSPTEISTEPSADDGVLNMPSNWAKLNEQKRLNFLFAAIERGDQTLAETMLPDVRLPYYQHNKDGETLLTLAIELGDYEMVRWLVEDAVINLKNEAGETPLTLAIKKQNPAIVDLVLERAKPDLANDHDETPLMLAINYSYSPSLVNTLADRGANINQLSNGVTPLARAVEKEHVQLAAMLVRRGADPSLPNTNGDIPLYGAVRLNHQVMAGILLYQSPQPIQDANWETPLGETLVNMAISQENSALVHVLVEGGANTNATDYLDNSPLNLAAERGMADVVDLLLNYGADPNHSNIMGTTPIMAAAQRGHTDIAEKLATAGADPEQRDYAGIAANDYGDFSVHFSDPYLQGELDDLLLEVDDD